MFRGTLGSFFTEFKKFVHVCATMSPRATNDVLLDPCRGKHFRSLCLNFKLTRRSEAPLVRPVDFLM
jgi:hypothetical protein